MGHKRGQRKIMYASWRPEKAVGRDKRLRSREPCGQGQPLQVDGWFTHICPGNPSCLQCCRHMEMLCDMVHSSTACITAQQKFISTDPKSVLSGEWIIHSDHDFTTHIHVSITHCIKNKSLLKAVSHQRIKATWHSLVVWQSKT